MTTQKTIGQLTELTAANTTDVVPIVDNSGQSGVTKRITVQNAFKSVPAGQAATPGLAFAGDVDTEPQELSTNCTLHWRSSSTHCWCNW